MLCKQTKKKGGPRLCLQNLHSRRPMFSSPPRLLGRDKSFDANTWPVRHAVRLCDSTSRYRTSLPYWPACIRQDAVRLFSSPSPSVWAKRATAVKSRAVSEIRRMQPRGLQERVVKNLFFHVTVSYRLAVTGQSRRVSDKSSHTYSWHLREEISS